MSTAANSSKTSASSSKSGDSKPDDTTEPKGVLQSVRDLLTFSKNKSKDPLDALSETEKEKIKLLRLGVFEKKRVIKLWREIVGKSKMGLTYSRYLQFFKMKNEAWVKRTYELMNSSLSGSVSFSEFLSFLYNFVIVDYKQSLEFCFRVLSRRGATYVEAFSVLDLEDIVNFVAMRYSEFNTIPVQRRRALDIFTYMDSDGDGGLDMGEFKEFAEHNKAFLKVSHAIQMHFRRKMIGTDFWVEVSRRIAYDKATGRASLAIPSRINTKGEMLAKFLGDPIVDKNGRAIKPLVPDAELAAAAAAAASSADTGKDMDSELNSTHGRKLSIGSILGQNSDVSLPVNMSRRPSRGMALSRQSSYKNDQDSSVGGPGGTGGLSSPSGMGSMSRQTSSGAIDAVSRKPSALSSRSSALSSSGDLVNAASENDAAEKLKDKVLFSVHSIEESTFADDFPAIVALNAEKKRKKKLARMNSDMQAQHFGDDGGNSERSGAAGGSSRVSTAKAVGGGRKGEEEKAADACDDCDPRAMAAAAASAAAAIEAETAVHAMELSSALALVAESQNAEQIIQDAISVNFEPQYISPSIAFRESSAPENSKEHRIVAREQRRQLQVENFCVDEYINTYNNSCNKSMLTNDRTLLIQKYRSELNS